MSDQQLKMLESCEKAESEVKRVYQQIDDALDNDDRSIRVRRLVTSCTNAITKAVKRHDQLLALTQSL